MKMKLFILFLFLATILLNAQNKIDSTHYISKNYIEKHLPECLKNATNSDLNTLFQNDKLYVLLQKNCNNSSSSFAPSTFYIFDSLGQLKSSNIILNEAYTTKDFCIRNGKFLFCGYKYERGEIMGFVAELTYDFKVVNIKLYPEMGFWKVLSKDSSIYLTGELYNKVVIKGQKIKLHEFKIDGHKINNDVVLIKMSSEFKIQNFGHYAIEGNLQDGESLIVNNNGFIAFSFNTVILRGSDHHDGNLFLIDNNFKLLWHKQYTDQYLGHCHVTPFSLNDKNEVSSFAKSYFFLESKNEALLPKYDSLFEKSDLISNGTGEKEQDQIMFIGIIKYNENGEEITKSRFRFDETLLNPERESYLFFQKKEGTGYLRLVEDNKKEVIFKYDIFTSEGKIITQNIIPKKLPPLFCFPQLYGRPVENKILILTK